MKHGRWLWAAAMTAAAVALLGGFTAAVDGAQQQPAVFPAMEMAAPEPAPPPVEPSADACMVTVRDETGAVGRKLRVADEAGEYLCLTAPNRRSEYLLELSPGAAYTLEAEDGMTVSFYLEDNASISNVQGDGWTDGEIVHLDLETRCTLRVIRAAGTQAVYTLTGEGYAETRIVKTRDGEETGQAVFSGLLPGTYTLSDSHGETRTVELTAEQLDLALGLD